MTTDVLALEEQRWAAMIANDLDTLDQLLHPLLSYTHSNAMVDTKDSYIANLRNGIVRYTSVDRENTDIIRLADTAIITGKATFTVHAMERDVTIISRYSSVWVNDGGRWQFVAWQNTPFP